LLVLPAFHPEAVRRGEAMAASTDDLRPGRVQQVEWIRFDRTPKGGDVVQFPVLLVPFRLEAPEIRVERQAQDNYRVQGRDWEDLIVVQGGGLAGTGWETDARLLRLRSEGGVTRATVIDGTYLRKGGKTLWHSAKPASGSGIRAGR
jgi:hypothetical protein